MLCPADVLILALIHPHQSREKLKIFISLTSSSISYLLLCFHHHLVHFSFHPCGYSYHTTHLFGNGDLDLLKSLALLLHIYPAKYIKSAIKSL